MSMPADLRTALVEALSSLPGMQLAVLFGSFARGCKEVRGATLTWACVCTPTRWRTACGRR